MIEPLPWDVFRMWLYETEDEEEARELMQAWLNDEIPWEEIV